jgi:hypothetical protein
MHQERSSIAIIDVLFFCRQKNTRPWLDNRESMQILLTLCQVGIVQIIGLANSSTLDYTSVGAWKEIIGEG